MVLAFDRPGTRALALALMLSVVAPDSGHAQNAASQGAIKGRHGEADRARANRLPRGEEDQALVDGWPLYRTPRGQQSFNDAMATLAATESAGPGAAVFKRCAELACPLSLPAINAEGWLPAGRLWTAADEYVLIVHSPRARGGQGYRRLAPSEMRYFVLHEFHSSSRNVDVHDTISSHSGAVFVPFYMSKTGVDARGRRFVLIVQVAPYDVRSVHASNLGSAGPGVEVAKNFMDPLEPLQARAGIVLAAMVKARAPGLRVINHQGREGVQMLAAIERRLAAIKSERAGSPLTLPFTRAESARIASAGGKLQDLIRWRGLPVIAPQPMAAAAVVSATAPPLPKLIEPIRPAARLVEAPRCIGAHAFAGAAACIGLAGPRPVRRE